MKKDLYQLGYKEANVMQMIARYVGDWEERATIVGPFLETLLKKYNNPKILDLALGAGQDSIYLLKNNYDVISNEIDQGAIDSAYKKANQYSVNLNIREYNWLEINANYIPEKFHFIFSLGNSFPTYLPTLDDMKKALSRLWEILEPGGTLLFDIRNHDYILQHREDILQNPLLYHRYLVNYLNKEVVAIPTEITDSKLSITYKDDIRREVSDNLPMYPVTDKLVMSMINEVLGNVLVKKFYDYKEVSHDHADFIEYVIIK